MIPECLHTQAAHFVRAEMQQEASETSFGVNSITDFKLKFKSQVRNRQAY